MIRTSGTNLGGSVDPTAKLVKDRDEQTSSVETVRVLLEQGAMISARDLEESSALHLAADGGHLEIVDLLIDKDAKLDTVERPERTPLHRSTWLGHGAAMKLLVDRGAVVDAVDNDGIRCAIWPKRWTRDLR